MKEIEILVEVFDDADKVKEVLNRFNYKGSKKVIDEYFYDPKREDLKPDKDNKLYNCLRLRQKDDEYSIAYKNDVFEGDKWLYSNEFETKVESKDIVREILNKLGLIKLLEINNTKHTYETDKYEIVLEEVKDLGLFMEVEYYGNEDIDPKDIKKDIDIFIKDLGINVSEELNMGKPEIYLRKFNINIQ